MTRHTPGPWGYVQCDPKMHGFIVIQPDNRNRVGIEVEGSSAESTANVRLVASAPDLLAACKALVEACENQDKWDLHAVDQARAAIEKAEGKI